MSKGDSSSFIKIVVLCILVILGIFYVNIMGLGHGVSEQEQVAAKLLNQRIDSTKDYVEKLEHQIMKLAMDKKNDEKGGKHIEDTLHSEGHKGTLIEHPMHHQILEHALRPNPENPNQFLPKHLVADITQHSKALPPPTVYAKVPEKHHRRHHHGHASQHASAETEQQNQVTPSSPSSTENTEQQSNFNPQLHPSAQGKFPDIPVDVEKIDPDFYNWLERIKEKFYCLEVNPHNIGYYHYHVRKAAGTTIRDIVKTSLSRFKKSAIARRQMLRPSVVNVDNYYETEGVVLLYPDILEIKDLLSMISLRDPINRILSLYWYEHVGWYDGVLKQPHRCKSMETWIEAWLDGSEFKNTFVKKFPDNNYVEIENYYVKSLIGHIYQSEHLDIHTQGGEELTSKDLEKAKEMLRKFDVIFITEWMGDDTEMDVVNTIFPGRTQIAPGHKVKGDFRMKERLRPTLAANEVSNEPV
jgi:hypothetical protein